MPSFLYILRRRNVLRVAAAYAPVAWIIIEAEETGDWGSLRAKAEVI